MKFAKLIELKNGHQVLLISDIDSEDDDCYQLEMIIDFEGVRLKTTLGGIPSKESIMESMEKFDEETANNYRESILESVKD